MSKIVDTITAKVKAIFAETEAPKDETKEEKLMVEAVIADSGIKITAEAWEVGQAVTAITEEGDAIALPADTYVLADGTTLVTDENGVITEITVAEVEVEAEKDEEEKEEMKADEKPVYVTQSELAEAMAPMLAALEKVSVKLSEMAPAKEEKAPENIETENKLLKLRLAEKRKAITEKAADKKAQPLNEKFGAKDHGFKSPTRKAVEKNFTDFDFTARKN